MTTQSRFPFSPRFFIKTGQLTLALLFAATATTGLAATDGAQPKLETLVVTATRIAQPLDQFDGSLSVVSRQDIQQVSSVHISELLARVPGVWISRGNGQEDLTAIRSPVLTGAGSCGAFYIAEDGVPVRPTGFCNVNELMDINTEQAQRIEVLRGPGTALHGSGALHGVINVISQAPTPDAGSQLSLEGGPHDYGRIKLSVGEADQSGGYRLNVNGASDGGYRDNSGFDQQKFTFRYDRHGDQWNSATLFSGTNLNQQTAGYVEGHDAYKNPSLQHYNPTPQAYRDSQTLRWQTHFQRSLDNKGVFIVTPYARYSDMQFLMHYLPGTPVEKNGQTSGGVQTTYRRPINDRLTLTQGFDAELTDAWLQQEQATGFSSFPAGMQYDYQVSAQVLAGFVSSDYQWTDRLSLQFGTRYESLTYDYTNKMISGDTDQYGNPCSGGCRYSRPPSRKDDFENLSGNAGLIYRWSDALIGTVRLAHGFRAPEAAELYRLQAGQLEPHLHSVELNSIEVGIKGDLGTVNYALTSYYMKKNHVIFQSSDRYNIDNGRTRHYGLEYQLRWQLGLHWDISADGTFARHQYTSNVTEPGSNVLISTKGNDMDTAPRHMSSVRLGWEPTDGTRVELEWLDMGSYYTDIENQHVYKGHNLLHLRVRQQLDNGFEVGLRVTNLTNKRYAERADYSFGKDRYFIGEPRSYYGDIIWHF